MSKVVVMDHPLIEQKIGIIRRKETGSASGRSRDRDPYLQDHCEAVKG